LYFGYRQDTKQADLAGQKPLFGANCPFCNTGIWAKKASFLLFPVFLPLVFLVKALVSKLSNAPLLMLD